MKSLLFLCLLLTLFIVGIHAWDCDRMENYFTVNTYCLNEANMNMPYATYDKAWLKDYIEKMCSIYYPDYVICMNNNMTSCTQIPSTTKQQWLASFSGRICQGTSLKQEYTNMMDTLVDVVHDALNSRGCLAKLLPGGMLDTVTCYADSFNAVGFGNVDLRSFEPNTVVKGMEAYENCSLLNGITIGNEVVQPASFAKTLGVTLDPNLGLDKHLMTLSRSSIASLQYIGRLRKYLDNKSCERLVHAFIISKIDYCNSILQGLPKQKLDYVQRLQNAAARVVTRTRRNEHISHVLQTLHWLPVRQRVQYKIALITYKALHSMAPVYLSTLVNQVIPRRTLRSSSQCRLHVPKSKTKTLGERAFSVCAPQIWNSLPPSITNSDNIDNFKSQLKTFLFKEAFK